jgi:hypothetical protein
LKYHIDTPPAIISNTPMNRKGIATKAGTNIPYRKKTRPKINNGIAMIIPAALEAFLPIITLYLS